MVIPTTICFVNNNVGWYYSSFLKDQDKEDNKNSKKDLEICKGFIKKKKKNERENEIKDDIFKALWRQCKELAIAEDYDDKYLNKFLEKGGFEKSS